jgi:hypothetical protein
MTAPAILKADPRPGDFLVVPVLGDVGKAIELGQFLTGQKFKPYEHAEVYIGEPDANAPYGYTASAYPNRQGIQALPYAPKDMAGSLWSSGLIDLTDFQRTAIVHWCLNHPKVAYSALDYLALALHRFRIPAPGLRDFIADTGHQICSQYADEAYNAAGVHLFNDNRWPGYVMPIDLAELLLAKMRGH